ncbi:MAG: hypothetical protein R3E01_21040 [Pirellulaceae bacterium]
MRRCLLAIIVITFVSNLGCGAALPHLFGPGHLYQQQLRATNYDPYADNSGAPPVLGGRPPDFQVQRSLPERTSWYSDSRGF